jgi:cell division protein ZapA
MAEPSKAPVQLEVQILDRPYKLSCPPAEQALLLDCVSLVDRRMRQAKQGSKLQSADRIAVMAALTLARDLLAPSGEGHTPSDPALRETLKKLTALADEALVPQEKLFD